MKKLNIKITILFLIVSLIPFIGISILFYIPTKQKVTTLVNKNLSNLSSEIGIEIEKIIFYAHTQIKSLSKDSIIKSEHAPIQKKLFEMRKIEDLYNIYEDITLINSNGIVLASTTYNYRGEWKYKSWFKQTIKGNAVVSPVHSILNPFRLVLIVTAPIIKKDGSVGGVIAGQVNMKRIWEITDRIKIGKTGFIFLTDSKGNLLAYPDKEKILYNISPIYLKDKILNMKKGTFACSTEEKDKICYFKILKGYGQYKGQSWRIGIIQDFKEAYALISKMRIQILIVAIIGLTLILILASLLSNNIVKPIKKLVKAAKSVAIGNLSTRVELKSKDEIGDLGKTFNQMALNLENTTVSIEVLKESEKRFNDITKNTGDWIWEIDALGRYTYSSSVSKKIFDYKPEEILGKYYYDLFLPEDQDKNKNDLLKIFTQKEVLKNYLNKKIKRNGQTVIIETSAVPILSVNGELIGYRGVDRDITKRKKAEQEKINLEEQLRQSEKLSSLGTLLSGVTHELNNKIVPILGFAQILQMETEDKKTIEKLKIIEESTIAAKSIIESMLAFARPSKEKKEDIDILEPLENTLRLLSNELKRSDITLNKIITKQFINNTIIVNGNSKQLGQIFLNIIKNAIESIEEDKNNRKIEIELKVESKNVLICITDNGIGMNENVKKKIFDPFFTTKREGEGTGLGMSVSYRIIESHKGKITLHSKPGTGTTFTISLPIVKIRSKKINKNASNNNKSNNIIKTDIKKHKKILIVDDESTIVELIESMLITLGYKNIYNVQSGRKALDVLNNNAKYDIVLLDYRMPEMNGEDTYYAVIKRYPFMKKKIIIISGDIYDPKTISFILRENLEFIRKPFNIETFNKIILKCLKEKPAETF